MKSGLSNNTSKDNYGDLGKAFYKSANIITDLSKPILQDFDTKHRLMRPRDRFKDRLVTYHFAKELKDAASIDDKTSKLFEIERLKNLQGRLIQNHQTIEQMEHNIQLYKAMLDITQQSDPSFKAYLLRNVNLDEKKSNLEHLKNKLEAQKKAYRRQLYLEGYDWMYSHLPDWEDVKRYAKVMGNVTMKTAQTIKSLYKLAKIVYPSSSNIEMYANQPMGFEIMGDKQYFDRAYKIECGVKKMYELNKGTVRRDLVYNEIYMPVSIYQKMLFAQINTQNEYSPEILFLIECANKGLELLL